MPPAVPSPDVHLPGPQAFRQLAIAWFECDAVDSPQQNGLAWFVCDAVGSLQQNGLGNTNIQ